MVTIQRISIVCICLAALTLGIGFAAGGYWVVLPVFAFLGGLWLGLRTLDWAWIHSVMLLLFTAQAAFGILAGLPAVWMLLCLAAALSAWDLEYFLRRVSSVEREAAAHSLARQHLRRLAAVIGAGLLAGGAALLIQARFTLVAELLAGLLAILALSQVIGYLRRESD